jgi:hypothetical protein
MGRDLFLRFEPDNGGDTFHQNVGSYKRHTALFLSTPSSGSNRPIMILEQKQVKSPAATKLALKYVRGSRPLLKRAECVRTV